MNFIKIANVLGLQLILFSITFITPVIVAVIYGEQTVLLFVVCALITGSIGVLLWLPLNFNLHYNDTDLHPKEGIFITAIFWIVLGIFSAVPFLLAEELNFDIASAIFESVSGLTTTGATLITGLEHLPKSLLFYRQQLQWFGGIGIVVIVVAFLPMLGTGSMQLFKSEVAGGHRGSKIAPRIADTAKILFKIYLILTIVCAVLYYLAGMTWFDAICHSFSTISIGGFSTYDQSMGYFDSPSIYLICMFFMLICAINFTLHFFFFVRRSFDYYTKNTETITYIFLIAIGIAITIVMLIFVAEYSSGQALLHGAFQVISALTTTGFVTQNFSAWPSFLPYFLITGAMIGGCIGSTAGGLKVIRVLYIAKQTKVLINQLIHPNGVFKIKINNHVVSQTAIFAVWGQFCIYTIVFYGLTLLLMATGLDFSTAWSAAVSSLSNLGPALGEFSDNYASASIFAKWILSIAMIMGRLEIFTLLLLLFPSFWRK